MDWQAVADSGIKFVILRAGTSKGMDTTFEDNYAGAKAAGLKVGVYFYSTAIDELEAVQEASLALEVVNGRSLDYPIFIDMEYSGMNPDGRADQLTIAQRSQIINAFCQTIQNSGYQAGVYSGEYFYNSNIDFNAIRPYTVWLANYTNDNQLPGYANRYDIWQFTDSGQVRGITYGVDMNVIF